MTRIKIFLRFIAICFASFQGMVYGTSSERTIPDPCCSIGPIPSWIKKIPVQPAPLGQAQDHEDLFLLIDNQIDSDEKAEYYHAAKYLPSQASIQDHSYIEIEFDPSYESIILHDLRVLRGGESLDRISTARMEIIQPEKGMGEFLYSGVKSWIIFLDDIQPGDVMEYGYSRLGRIPVLKDYLTTVFGLQYSSHLNHGFFRIIGSKNHPLHFKSFRTKLQPLHQTIENDREEWIWEITDIPPCEINGSSLPSWYIHKPLVQISEFDQWADVAKWGSQLFRLTKRRSEEMIQLVRTLQSKSPDLEQQILQAIQFVQNDIRYSGFELGDNAYLPYDPHIVLQRRSGDCKDKTLLLKAILDLMGVKSFPVWVHSSLKEHIIDWHPSPTILNHSILQIQLGDEQFWIDPTQPFQGGNLRTMVCYPYGRGLVLSEETSGLTEIPFSSEGSSTKAVTTLKLGISNDPSRLVSETLYTGYDADVMRRFYKQNGVRTTEDHLHEYYAKQYGIINSAVPLELKDSQEKNELVITVAYDVVNPWKVDDKEKVLSLDVNPGEIVSALTFSIDATRKMPHYLSYPCNVVEDIYVVCSETSWEDNPMRLKIDNDEVVFLSDIKLKDDSCLHYRYELMTKKDHIPTDKMRKWRKNLQKMSNTIFQAVTMPIESEPEQEEEGEEDVSPPFPTPFIKVFALGCIALAFSWLSFMLLRK